MTKKPNRGKAIIANVATIVAILLGAVVVIFTLRLLILGQAVTIVTEIPITVDSQEIPSVASVEYVPYPAAIVPLIAVALLLSGLTMRKQLLIAWIGLAILFAFSVLFLFSSGAALLPVAGLLLILLTIIQLFQRNVSQTTYEPQNCWV